MKQVKKMTFEEAFAELEETVQKLEEGGATLDDSLALFERGQELAAYCGVQLDRLRVLPGNYHGTGNYQQMGLLLYHAGSGCGPFPDASNRGSFVH